MSETELPAGLFADRSRELAVVVTVTPWREPPRIRHQLTRQLMRFYNVLYVQLPYGSSSEQERVEVENERLVLLTLPRRQRWKHRFLDNVPPVHRAFNRSIVRRIEDTMRRIGYSTAVLVNFQVHCSEIIDLTSFHPKLFIHNDDFLHGVRFPTLRRMRRHQQRILMESDICMTVSEALAAPLRMMRPDIGIILPGHEFDALPTEFGRLADRGGPVRVCFMGYIDGRLRYDWLEQVARDPMCSLTLIGPVSQPGQVAALRALPGVTIREPLTGIELQAALQGMDVLVMPYDVSHPGPLATTTPNKLFQYLACGKPVVISDMPNFISLPNGLLYRAATASAFVQCIHAAAAEDNDEFRAARLAIAADNSWRARGDELVRSIQLGRDA